MIVEDTYFATCPAYGQKVTLKAGYSKKKSSPKDIGFTYNFIGVNCDFTRCGEQCPYVDCPLIEKLGLTHSVHQ